MTEYCPIPNIGAKGQRQRMLGGVLMVIFAALVLVILILTEAPRAARLLVFFPTYLGALGILQAREKT